jgi:heptosyltransferase-2
MSQPKLLVVGPSWVGDMVMAQSLFKTILSQSPTTLIDVIAPEWSLALTKRMPEVNKGIISPIKHGEFGIMKRFQLSEWIRPSKYDQAIVMTRSWKAALVPWFAGIPIRTGYRGEMRYFLINDMRSLGTKTLNQTVKRFVALGSLSSQLPAIESPSLSVSVENIDIILNKLNLDIKKPIMAIMPGAEYGPAKQWPADYFSTVVQTYLSKDWNVCILGSQKDKGVATEIKSSISLNISDRLFDLTGMTTLLDAIDLLSVSKVALTNDSGLMHIAAAVNTPLIALYGPTSPEFTPPLSKNSKVLRKITGYIRDRQGTERSGYHKSLIDLRPEEVLDELEIFIKKNY